MPPPPPPPQPLRRESRSHSRRSLQVPSSSVSQCKRLSMSMTNMAAPSHDADVSCISLDESGRRASNQTVASLSHIAQLLSDMSGHMSTRLVVDNLLENCSVPSKSRSKSSTAGSQSEESGETSKRLPVTPKCESSTVREETPTPPSGEYSLKQTCYSKEDFEFRIVKNQIVNFDWNADLEALYLSWQILFSKTLL